MSTIDERIAAYAATLEAANAELTELETLWNNGSPVGHSCEQRSALWQRIVAVRAVVYEQIKLQLLAAMGVSPSNADLYEYLPESNDVRYVGNG